MSENNENIIDGITVYETSDEIEKFKPKLTRDNCSIYEFCRIITDLANHISVQHSIEKYIDELEVKDIIEPCDLAYRLLRKGRFDAILDRGYEKVTFSELKVDPFIYETVEKYLDQQEAIRKNTVLEKLNLIEK